MINLNWYIAMNQYHKDSLNSAGNFIAGTMYIMSYGWSKGLSGLIGYLFTQKNKTYC